jgi:catalase
MQKPQRKVALLVAEGVKAEPVAMLLSALSAAGAAPSLIGTCMGTIRSADGQEFEIDATPGDMPSTVFDAMALPDGEQAVTHLAADGHTLEFVQDQYRYGKTIFVGAASAALLTRAGVPVTLPSGEPDPGLILCSPSRTADRINDFLGAIGPL